MVNDQEQRWERLRGVIYSSKGGWVAGQGVNIHGYSLYKDLVGKASFFQVLVLNVTGTLPELRLAQWIEANFICCSWPDPRIWCNQIAALGGSARISTVSAVCAGSLSGNSSDYGSGSVNAAGQFLMKSLAALAAGKCIDEVVETHAIKKGRLMAPGFVRPIAAGDERVNALVSLAHELGFIPGDYEQLVFSMRDYLRADFGETLNVNAYGIAFLLDQGFSLKQIQRLMTLIFNGGLHACYAEYRDLPPDSFLPLHCNDIDYIGVSPRPVPPVCTMNKFHS